MSTLGPDTARPDDRGGQVRRVLVAVAVSAAVTLVVVFPVAARVARHDRSPEVTAVPTTTAASGTTSTSTTTVPVVVASETTIRVPGEDG